MSFPSYANLTDDVNEIQAADINVLYTDVAAIARAAAIGAYVNSETLTGNKTLVDADYTIQSFNPTAARNVTLPALAATNHAFYIYNRSTSYMLTIKTPAAATLGYVFPGSGCLVFSDGVNGWMIASSPAFALATNSTPASSSAAGNPGQICWDTSYVYICTATSTWKRIALSSF